MKKMRTNIGITAVFMLMMALQPAVKAQDGVTTVGLQFKPIIPTEALNSGYYQFRDENWNIDLSPKLGVNFGMVIRRGFTKRLSWETGINFVNRGYTIDASYNDTVFTEKNLRVISYEIPLKGLVYIPMTDNWYVNAALGTTIGFYPKIPNSFDDHFINRYSRKGWVQGAVLANVGFEYRTEDKGYWYIGATAHRPFTPIAITDIQFREEPESTFFKAQQIFDLTGNYLTLDLRYFFHEEPTKKKRR